MAQKDEKQLRRLFCEVGRWLDERRYVVATAGSLSARMGDNAYLLSPARMRLGALEPDAMVVTDAGGAPRREQDMPSDDWRLHLTCYRERPDVDFVVHAHPPLCLAATAAGLSLARHVLPQVVLHLGTVPTAAYATPSGQASADSIRSLVVRHDAVVLDRQGTITLGTTLEEATMKLELVEHQAEVMICAGTIGVVKVLPREEVNRLAALRARMTLAPQAVLPDPGWNHAQRADTQAPGS